MDDNTNPQHKYAYVDTARTKLQRAMWILITIPLFVLLMQINTGSAREIATSAVRTTIQGLLAYYVFRGSRGARLVLSIFMVLGFVFLVSRLTQGPETTEIVILGVLGTVWGYAFYCMWFPGDVQAYFEANRN